jgi:hypothetical protein
MRKRIIFGFVAIIFVAAGCKKEVIEECKKRYVVSATVIDLPSGFDIFSGPDLRCDLATSASSYWSYPSYSVDNVTGLPITISFEKNILLSEENWDFRLVDEDPINEDIIYTDSFKPYSHKDGKIPLYKDGVKVMELNYKESE